MDDIRIDEPAAPRPRHQLPKPDQINGRLFSANALTAQEISRIEAYFSNKLSQKVVLKPIVDESLIAGVRVEVGGSQWDGSARGTLLSLREHLEA